jgi:hypothetical protein
MLFQKASTIYDESADAIRLEDRESGKSFEIAKANAALWHDEAGTTPYTLASLISFVRKQTNFKSASGGSGANLNPDHVFEGADRTAGFHPANRSSILLRVTKYFKLF